MTTNEQVKRAAQEIYDRVLNAKLMRTVPHVEDFERIISKHLASVPEQTVDEVAKRINANVERMEQSQKVDPEIMNLTLGNAEQSPRVCVKHGREDHVFLVDGNLYYNCESSMMSQFPASVPSNHDPNSLHATCRSVWVCKKCGNCADHCKHKNELNFHEDLDCPCSGPCECGDCKPASVADVVEVPQYPVTFYEAFNRWWRTVRFTDDNLAKDVAEAAFVCGTAPRV